MFGIGDYIFYKGTLTEAHGIVRVVGTYPNGSVNAVGFGSREWVSLLGIRPQSATLVKRAA